MPQKLLPRIAVIARTLWLLPLCCLTAAAPAPPPPAIPDLDWHIERPFRLFTRVEDWTRLAPRPCSNPNNPPSRCDSSMDQWYSRVFAPDDEQGTRWPEPKDLAWHPGRLWSYRDKSYQPGYFPDPTDYVQAKTYFVDIVVPANFDAKQCSVVVGGRTAAPTPCKNARAEVPRGEGTQVQVFLLPERQLIGSSKIRVTDLLVVGLGDSFASGEGNPDRPAGWHTSRLAAHHRTDKTWVQHYNPLGTNTAHWLDEQCHRSLYSHQNLAAMWLAAQDPHRAVTFVHLACSGAEISDGLLHPQSGPPGGGDHVAKSQLASLNEILCTKGRPVGTQPCEHTKQIDLLFLSIGGNDVGFGHIINHYLFPPSQRDRPALASFYHDLLAAGMGHMTAKQANRLISTQLIDRYRSFSAALAKHTKPSLPKHVLLTAYPNPLLREDAKPCALTPGRDVMFEGLSYAFWKANLLGTFAIDEKSQDLIEAEVIGPLHEAQQKFVAENRANRWVFVAGFISALTKHGMCAVADPTLAAKELGWSYPTSDGKWAVLDPAQWRAYHERPRWFRTVHDSILTQRSSDIRVELHGAFHPAARAHAEMARAVVDAAGAALTAAVAGQGSPAGPRE